MSTPGRRAAVITALVGALVLTGCTGAGDGAVENGTADGPSGELTIFAAASLSGAFDELSTRFEEQHPDVDVLPISYDGSSVLATQLIEGASADVFASADERNMTKVIDAGLTPDAEAFATNTMQIAVAPDNPDDIDSLASLAEDDLLVVMCAAEVPCGAAAHTLLDAAQIAVTPVSEEQNVTAVLAKVKSGEADAGLVYRTDIAAAGDAVDAVDIEGAEQATNVYPLSALTDAANPEAAEAFVAFVLSDAGQAVLRDFGFGAP
ncbi:molybdate ABC transporter substrate-binding protein [Microbacterium murale]|uniref:Molybdate transport system substrate-binding protein n=1 Tax=Microbacterium murale TaxID=1081040 RepID=A0ABU0P7W0_9MICO|nr:molybdate ABC transporter substrate-binding protein [Microbacterium murale]MDQ0643420.1 molybdate transport system substrate-binding protein [Microbacterium murale]